jgi:hypothetical protein
MPNLLGMTVEEVIAYLEAKGLSPDYTKNRTKFKHPQRLSRTVSIQRTHENKASLTFSNSLPGFADSWNLSPEGELPQNLDHEVVKEALDDFFEIVFGDPPPGSPSFEQRWGEVKEVVRRLAVRYQRPNYEMSFDDLFAIAFAKVQGFCRATGTYQRRIFVFWLSALLRMYSNLFSKSIIAARAGLKLRPSLSPTN